MATFWFFGVPEEWPKVLAEVLSVDGLELITNGCFPTRTLPRFTSVTQELLTHLARINKLVYVTGEFTYLPIRLVEHDTGRYKGTYSIDGANGGPLITLSLPSLVHHDAVPTLIPGHLYIAPYYGFPDGPGYFSPPPGAKAAYSAIMRNLKGVLRQRQSTGGKVWIGDEAFDTYQAGSAQILIKGRYFSS